jgi:hypothetical protein
MKEDLKRMDCAETQAEVELLEKDVLAFRDVSGEKPDFESLANQFESFNDFKTMFKMIIELCKEYQRIYPRTSSRLSEVCHAYTELDMMVNLHVRLLYPYFNILQNKEDRYTLFDGSIYSVIHVLQNSSDKIRSALNLKQWESVSGECNTYQSFSKLLSDLCPKVMAYLDIHDRYIYPEAIRLEEED